ncbi:nitrate reductase molybdenum cofactor assembly chaperone [Mycolicibacterium setense]|uniref:nitrate reductase molybdenum cofactor assembly chaperone n=1 Tax=Mycolicibacterium setense TaxID=431269 RepID=UPI000575C92C|nr:nitrate reductase molybdenum cofactor assembly chaperone [Mycolicibacterium setense]KHO17901.1 nitrate reductase [Mycolicibacterium setense]MCV7112257.1 nitrate reductase molybdenum cofactor assembly chaperone [Mycolicibacterium setense]
MKLLTLGRRTGTGSALSERQQRLVWRITALLLDYPTAETADLVDQLDAVTAELPDSVRAPLTEFLRQFGETDPMQRASNYVETFDMQRRSSLHLTYYAYGDTRKRGMALLRFKHAYRQASIDIGDSELPDYLPMVLEFAATVDQVQGERLLAEHVPVLELLRLSLQDNDSYYTGLLAAVLATLPPVNSADRRRIAQLAAEGPPDEDVGLDPFAMDPMTMDPTGQGARR